MGDHYGELYCAHLNKWLNVSEWNKAHLNHIGELSAEEILGRRAAVGQRW